MTPRGGARGAGVALTLILVAASLAAGCEYVVVPPDDGGSGGEPSEGWTAMATTIAPDPSGGLRIDLTIVNRTGDWSAMTVVPGSATTLTAGDGATVPCESVDVGTGGHRLAPGFQMRGFIGGTKASPETTAIAVSCAGATDASGASLTIPYRYVTGEYDYYDPEATQTDATLEVDLDAPASGLTYPVAEPIEGLIQAADAPMTGINDVVLRLEGIERGGEVLTSSWIAENPGEYPSSIHIGEPPVIGSDGIVYGFWESPDLASVPITPPGESVSWTTEVAVPDDVAGLVMLLSVESKKARTFVNYALDISAE